MKKKTAVAAVATVCLIAIIAVANRHKDDIEVANPETEITSATVAEVSVSVPKIVTNKPKEKATEPSEKAGDNPKTFADADIGTDENGDEVIEQNFTESTKPAPPEPPAIPPEQATNPATPPAYTPAQTAVTEATTAAPKTTTTQGGDKQNGKTYIPGLGWVQPAPTHGEISYGMVENGNKIGTFG